MFSDTEWVIMLSLGACLLAQVSFYMLEWPEAADAGISNYLTDFYNLIDATTFVLFLWYVKRRVAHPQNLFVRNQEARATAFAMEVEAALPGYSGHAPANPYHQRELDVATLCVD
jgi:hypothetical protein